MPLLKAEADKLSNNQLVQGIVEQIIERDDLFAVLPFVGVSGKAYVYNREKADNLTTGSGMPAFADPNDTVVEGAAKFDEVTTRLRILIGDVDVDKFIQETESDQQSQKAIQIAAKAKSLGRLYKNALINGNATTNSKEFDGLAALSAGDSAQVISAGTNGAALTLSMLDQLLDTVPNGADAIVMRSGTLRAFRSLLRAAGGTTAADYQLAAFGRPMLTHNGVPILVNDFISATETAGTATATTSIYAVRLNEYDGLHGLYGGRDAGVRVEEIGTVQNKDATRTRLKWYAGLALKSTKSLARLQGITNV